MGKEKERKREIQREGEREGGKKLNKQTGRCVIIPFLVAVPYFLIQCMATDVNCWDSLQFRSSNMHLTVFDEKYKHPIHTTNIFFPKLSLFVEKLDNFVKPALQK